MRLRKKKQQKAPKRYALPGAGVLAGLGIIGGAVVLLRKRGSKIKGAALEATAPARQAGREYDDVTLAQKVRSEIFRNVETPAEDVSVNGRDGVIELRGRVAKTEDGETLAKAAAGVSGVKGVDNLLHVPGEEPGHSPISDPDEVRDRADR